MSSTDLALDVSPETARAVHRVVRGMHDGECPKCHHLFDSDEIIRSRNDDSMQCPRCRFEITSEEKQAAIRLFGPIMDRNLEVFEEWRAKFHATNGRDLCKVIDAILLIVPESDEDLVNDLRKAKRSAEFKAPELMDDCWREVSGVLEAHIGAPSLDWERQVAAVFLGERAQLPITECWPYKRNLVTILEAMLAVVPDDQSELIDAFTVAKGKAGDWAAQPRSVQLRHIIEIMDLYMPEPCTGWQRQVVDLFFGVE